MSSNAFPVHGDGQATEELKQDKNSPLVSNVPSCTKSLHNEGLLMVLPWVRLTGPSTAVGL